MRARDVLLAMVALLLAIAGYAHGGLTAAPQTLAPAPLHGDRLDAELAAARKTRELVADKLAARDADLKGRVRALYKLTRGGLVPLWVDERARVDLVHRRAASRRMILRDLEEEHLLRDELEVAERNERRLTVDVARAAEAQATPVAAIALVSPAAAARIVDHFGPYRDDATKVRLARRGVDLAVTPGAAITAPAAGRVTWVGTLHGVGGAVVLDLGGGVLSIVGGLGAPVVVAGDSVAQGAPLGYALGDRVSLEVRRGGAPIDPETVLHGASHHSH